MDSNFQLQDLSRLTHSFLFISIFSGGLLVILHVFIFLIFQDLIQSRPYRSSVRSSVPVYSYEYEHIPVPISTPAPRVVKTGVGCYLVRDLDTYYVDLPYVDHHRYSPYFWSHYPTVQVSRANQCRFAAV